MAARATTSTSLSVGYAYSEAAAGANHSRLTSYTYPAANGVSDLYRYADESPH